LPEFASSHTEQVQWPRNSEGPGAHPGRHSQKTSRPRAARYAVPSAAHLLQALWREDRDLPIGSYVSDDGKSRKLSEAAGKAGANFLTAKIAHIARRETAYREIGGLTDFEC
jgi:hypothetical protein